MQQDWSDESAHNLINLLHLLTATHTHTYTQLSVNQSLTASNFQQVSTLIIICNRKRSNFVEFSHNNKEKGNFEFITSLLVMVASKYAGALSAISGNMPTIATRPHHTYTLNCSYLGILKATIRPHSLNIHTHTLADST